VTSVQWSAWLAHTRQHPPTIEVCPKTTGWENGPYLSLLGLQELQADMHRRQRVLMNASLIEARDQEERAGRLLAGISATTPQAVREISDAQVTTTSPSQQLPSAARKDEAASPLPDPTHRPLNNLPKTGPDRSDEPQSWTPRSLSRT
jgi:NADH dehydrogenase [ubiquinone] 1 alpha subcomplex assembly factor 2